MNLDSHSVQGIILNDSLCFARVWQYKLLLFLKTFSQCLHLNTFTECFCACFRRAFWSWKVSLHSSQAYVLICSLLTSKKPKLSPILTFAVCLSLWCLTKELLYKNTFSHKAQWKVLEELECFPFMCTLKDVYDASLTPQAAHVGPSFPP